MSTKKLSQGLSHLFRPWQKGSEVVDDSPSIEHGVNAVSGANLTKEVQILIEDGIN